jgi:hypothetical protein
MRKPFDSHRWGRSAAEARTSRSRNAEGVADDYIQGFVNLVATSAASGGNVIVPRSNKRYDELRTRFSQNPGFERSFWERVHDECPDVFEEVIIAHVEAGDVFL